MIAEWRERIDILDRQILGLLSRRAEIACRIAREKRTQGMPVLCPEREEEVMGALRTRNPGPLDGESVERVFRAIVAESRSLAGRARAEGEVLV
jgi:chorismate mutase-like protein